MKNTPVLVLCLLMLFSFSGCDTCDEPQRSTYPPLTQTEKAVIPQEVNDTLHFVDNAGSKYYLVCTKKELKGNGYSSTGHIRPCDDAYYSWERITGTYSGNLTDDQGAHLSISADLNPSLNPGESSTYPHIQACGGRTGHYFTLTINAATFYGFTTKDILPRISNFNYRGTQKLDGKLYHNINSSSVTPNLQTSCPAPAKNNSTIDSVYYSTQAGIIRITTAGGKKYQRVL